MEFEEAKTNAIVYSKTCSKEEGKDPDGPKMNVVADRYSLSPTTNLGEHAFSPDFCIRYNQKFNDICGNSDSWRQPLVVQNISAVPYDSWRPVPGGNDQTTKKIEEDPSKAAVKYESSEANKEIESKVFIKKTSAAVKDNGVHSVEHATNKVLIDGKMHEVIFLDKVAVVEQNGLPHRIYFTGSPKVLIIDGIMYNLSFKEEIVVQIDNISYAVKYGAPSRELFIGEFFLSGKFGGPPIIATVNGKKHQFQLSGPPPEVYVEKDPFYQLGPKLYDYHNQKRLSENQDGIPCLQKLLQKLKKDGILKKLSPDCRESSIHVTSNEISSISKNLQEPIYTYDAEAIKSFKIEALMQRHPSVIELLQKSSKFCRHCGMPYTTEEEYMLHINQHIVSGFNQSNAPRFWYMEKDVWIKTHNG